MSPAQNQTAVARGPSHRHFVITVDFTVKPEHFEPFMSLLNENAAASVRDEPGCLRFDVMTPADKPKPASSPRARGGVLAVVPRA